MLHIADAVLALEKSSIAASLSATSSFDRTLIGAAGLPADDVRLRGSEFNTVSQSHFRAERGQLGSVI